jgi:hypothetical protein
MMSTKSPARRSEPEIAMMEQLADTLDNHSEFTSHVFCFVIEVHRKRVA